MRNHALVSAHTIDPSLVLMLMLLLHIFVARPAQDSPTLNEQTHLDLKHGGGVEQGMPTTRGLTLSEVCTAVTA